MIQRRQRAGLPDWLVIARREFLERVRTKWFVIVTLLGPILMIGMMVMPVLLARSSSDARVQIVDRSGVIGEAILPDLAEIDWKGELVAPDTTEATLRGRIADGKIEGFLVVPADVLAGGETRYQGENATSQMAMALLYRAVATTVQRARGDAKGIPRPLLAEVMAPVRFDWEHTTGEGPTNATGLLVVGYAILFVLYMSIVLYASNVMRSVLQEKTNRIVEIMAAAAKPRALMIGKIAGVGAVGLLQLTLWVGMAVLTMKYRGAILGVFGVDNAAGWSVPPLAAIDVVVILVYFLLGFFLYSSIFAAIGAMVSSEQEAQQVQAPVIMLLVIPMVSMSVVSNQPRGTAAEVMTQIPLSSPVLMPMRWMLGGASPASLAMSVAILVVATALIALLAGRIYRTGILMLGKRPSLAELWRWLRYPG